MSSTLGLRNPLRYRGYVYDIETKLYYLQSRYYNPQWGRFLNADVFLSTGQGLAGNNMFVYCGNNPIMCTDTTGAFFFTAMGALTGFIASAATAMLTCEPQEKWLDIAIASSVDELIFLAMNNANGNLITGLIISESTGIATWLGTTIAE